MSGLDSPNLGLAVCEGPDLHVVPTSKESIPPADVFSVPVEDKLGSSPVPFSHGSGVSLEDPSLCSPPILDLAGLCHCPNYSPAHVPVIIPRKGQSFPLCHDPCFWALYIEDALLAPVIRLDDECVPLLPNHGPHGRLAGCGLGIPGS